MKYWITKLVIYTLLLYVFVISTHDAIANQLTSTDEQQLQALASVDLLASANTNFGFRKLVKTQNKLEGLFTLYYHQDSNQIYWEIKPEQLNQNYLATATLDSGIGENGIYSGLPLSDFLFYFQRVKNNLHFVARNVKFRTNPSQPEQRSLARSFSDSVIYSLKIDSINPHNQNILINLDNLLMQDFPGLTNILKYALGADYRLEPSKSYFGDVKSFPKNLEIETIYNFSAPRGANLVTLPDNRHLTLKVNYSFSQLPENNGYIPRLADDRVGYFITAFQDFSKYNTSQPFVRYINRWHLEPSDPTLPLSPPKKPIVFWIENAVPLLYRDAIREGVLMWNKAFKKAGFLNAIEVRQMPDDADWHPSDVRYNTIRWFNSWDANFARGMIHVNPYTGEIINADIVVDANMLRSIQQESHPLLTAHSFSQNGLSPLEQNSCQLHSPAIANVISENVETFPQQLFADNDFCYSAESSEQAAIGAMALSLLENSTPSSQKLAAYVHQYLRSLIAHEVGHTLGLRHNFHGSTMLSPQELNNTEITHAQGLVGSVMDYLPLNIAPPGVKQGDYFPEVVGPYDEWAIEYGYKKSPDVEVEIIPEAETDFLQQIAFISGQPELSYATDEDIRDINPLVNVWDLSSDVLLYSQWQMDNARIMWQNLDNSFLSKGESYSHLRVLFNRVLKYYFRNAALLPKYIGGQSFTRVHRSDDINWAFVPVSLSQQRQALAKLQKYLFAEDAFTFSPQLLNQLAPSRWEHWGNHVSHQRLDYPIHDRILVFQKTVLRSLLDSDRLNHLRDIELKVAPGEALSIPELLTTLQQGIWTEVLSSSTPNSISSLRRSLQTEHLNILFSMVLNDANMIADGQTIAWYELHQLQKAINIHLQRFTDQLDIYTLAHLQYSGDRIEQALNAHSLPHSAKIRYNLTN